MSCHRWGQKKDPILDSGEGDSAEDDGDGRDEESLLFMSPSPQHSPISTSTSMHFSKIPACSMGDDYDSQNDITTRVSIRSPSSSSTRRKSVALVRHGFLLVAASALLLMTTATATVVVLTAIRNNSDSPKTFLAQNLVRQWFRRQRRRRFLRDSNSDNSMIHNSGAASSDPVLNNTFVPPIMQTNSPSDEIVFEATFLPTVFVQPSKHPTTAPSMIKTTTSNNSTVDDESDGAVVEVNEFKNTNAPTLIDPIDLKPSCEPSTNSRTSMPIVSVSPSPTMSPITSNYPTRTVEPTLSLEPSESPSVSSQPATIVPTVFFNRQATEVNIEMILTNVPHELNIDQIRTWEDVTSAHVIEHYGILSSTFPDDWPVRIVDVDTTFVHQVIVTNEENLSETDDGALPTVAKPIEQRSPPPTSLVPADEIPTTTADAIAETITLKIIYNQAIFGETDLEGGEGELNKNKELFIYPFSANSFDYSISLTHAMNWSDWIIVKVDPGERKSPTLPPAPSVDPKLTTPQTISISVAIVIGACLIVVFLLWDRTHKADGRQVDDRQVDLEESDSSRITFPIAEPYSQPLSTRSAPAYLRKSDPHGQKFLKEERARLPPTSEGSHKSTTSIHRNGESRSSSPDNSPHSAISSKIPKQVPIPMQRISGEVSIVSTSTSASRSASNRGGVPYPPPMPHRSAFEPPVAPSVATTINTYDVGSYSSNQLPSSHSQRRAPSRVGPFSMRVSSISDDSMADFSFVTDNYKLDREDDSDDYAQPPTIENPHHHYMSRVESPTDAFLSPLHIPDEEDLISSNAAGSGGGLRAKSPESPMPTILGLEPIPDRVVLAPS